jgi:predicted MFS family arabinose efflux permease
MDPEHDRYPPATQSDHAPARAWYALSILIAAVLLAYVDRQIISLLVDSLRRDLALSDTKIGLLQGPAFAFFYAGAAIPLGWLVDRLNRRHILIAGVLLWSAATAASGFAADFSTLLFCRVGVALGEASLIPAVFSLVGDYFPPSRRATAFSIYMAVILVGASAAMGIGGIVIRILEHSHISIGTLDAPWRLAFVLVAAPGPLVAAMLLTLREPRRRVQPAMPGAAREKSIGAIALLITALAGTSATFQTLMAWFPTVLVRLHGWSPGSSGTAIGLVSGGAALLAAATAAVIGRRNTTLGMLTAVTVCVLIASPFAYGPAIANATAALVATGVLAASILTAYSLAPVILQAVSPGTAWGRVAALFKLAESVGVAVGAVVVGMLSDHLSRGSSGIGSALAAATFSILAVTGTALLITRRKLKARTQA